MDTPKTDKQLYRYYLTQRPPAPGAIPRGSKNTVSFDTKQEVDGLEVWGYVEYDKPLTEQQISDYELTELTDDLKDYLAKQKEKNKQVDEHKRIVELGMSVTGVRLADAETTGKVYEMYQNGEMPQAEWDKYVDELITSNQIRGIVTGKQIGRAHV